MQDFLKSSAKLFLRVFVINILCLILVISTNVITTGFFTENIGYTVYGAKDGAEQAEVLYEHKFADGEDLKFEEYEKAGYILTKVNNRSEVSKQGKSIFLIVTQVMTLVLFINFVFSHIWERGNKDSNLAAFGHIKGDKLLGFKTGLAAIIPYAIFYLILSLNVSNIGAKFPLFIIKFLSAAFYSIYELIFDGLMLFGELKVLQIVSMFATLLIVPIITGLAYYLGYKDISIAQKLMYKKERK
ncbi:MAG: hypothetical protein E7560_00920 [Ruminococcaceae bacterium]|nr:hypothetical protein [Oscillospiraceae bacterium]